MRLELVAMAKPNPTKDPKLRPDAWARFERAVDVVAKPQHRTAADKTKASRATSPDKRARKSRVKKGT
jgi:hypothetical protein